MWNTLERLSSDYPDAEFVLLIGGDNWASFSRWYRADDLLNRYRVAVYPRRGEVLDETALPSGVQVVRAELLDISSTEVRCRLAEGRSVRRLVPRCVADYMAEHRLYTAKEGL